MTPSDREGFRRIEECRICGNRVLEPVLNLGEQSLTGVFPRNRDQKVTRGPLELVKCHGGSTVCGLLQLRHSYRSAELYGENYGYRSALNQSMVGHLGRTIEQLRAVVPLQSNDVVLDIGSNDGTTLGFYPGNLVRVGMDPTAAKFGRYYQPGIVVVPDFFSAARFDSEMGGRRAKIVTSIAMFYDLDRPLTFVEEVVRILDDDGIWHFEQSYMPTMLSQGAYDTVCHEHLEYYGLRQIEWMMQRSGLKILRVALNPVNGGSFSITAARESSRLQPDTVGIRQVMAAEEQLGLCELAPYVTFAGRVSAHRDRLLDMLDSIARRGEVVFGYGASTKGNVILQFCGIDSEQIPFIAEVNEEKFGCLSPGSGIPIISEAAAHAMKPDYFLVMPWHFRENLIERETRYLKGGGKLIFPLPALETVAFGGQ